jgi:23S rRNA pseudouridine1911/1915/1917 synthase
MSQIFYVEETHKGMRIDMFLARHCLTDYSRSQLQKIIKNSNILVNDKPVTPHYILKESDVVTYDGSPVVVCDAIVPQKIPIDVIYEDADVLIINKQAGLVVHPAAGNKENTLVNALKYYLKDNLSTYGGDSRAGIVHRLDKETSGLMIIAKNDFAHKEISNQFKERTILKSYLVIVKGTVQHDQGKCDQPIGKGRIFRKRMIVEHSDGKNALSEFTVIERFHEATLLSVRIHTGRTHQIRVHMKYLGYPVLGDLVYGVSSPLIDRQCLHAHKLNFHHPRDNRQLSFEAPMPDDMTRVLNSLTAL